MGDLASEGAIRITNGGGLTQKEEADGDSGRILGFNARYFHWLTPGQVFVLILSVIGCPGIRWNWTSRCAVDRTVDRATEYMQSRNNDRGGVAVVVAPGRSGPQFLISDPVSDLTLAIKELGM